MTPRFKDGDRVRLKANEEEGWHEEPGTVVGEFEGSTYCVRVDVEYREDAQGDDGLREVTEDQLEAL